VGSSRRSMLRSLSPSRRPRPVVLRVWSFQMSSRSRSPWRVSTPVSSHVIEGDRFVDVCSLLALSLFRPEQPLLTGKVVFPENSYVPRTSLTVEGVSASTTSTKLPSVGQVPAVSARSPVSLLLLTAC
jgi:hypothetical protein